MRLSSLVLWTTLSAFVVANQQQGVFNFDKWTQDDLKEYINDHTQDLNKITSKSLKELKNDASELWSKHAQPKPWWQFWKDDKYAFPWTTRANSGSISDWFFDTWSTDSLRNFLKEHGMQSTAEDTRDIMIDKIKANFHKISKEMKSSGLYPSNSYFNTWTNNDLINWLNKYKVKFDHKAVKSRNDLVRTVKNNMNYVSNYVDEQRLNLLNDLDFANKDFKIKANEVSNDVFDTWSTRDLEKWLSSHEVEMEDKMINSRDYLMEQANKNKALLKDDIKWYLHAMKKKASTPVIGGNRDSPKNFLNSLWQKTASLMNRTKSKTDQVINDTFLIGIENWSKNKLKEFLDMRDVKYPYFATKRELIDLAKNYRNKPLDEFKRSSMESLNELRGWASEKKEEVKDTKAYDKVSGKMQDLNEEAANLKEGFNEKVNAAFQKWSEADLKDYLKGYGINVDEAAQSKDDLIKKAKENTQWFFGYYEEPTHRKLLRKAKNFARHIYFSVFGY
ncbi:hypothetical protein KAFR_0A02960 [Kazachstania africana CBS 2517]|uniref:Meiotic sister chromatid recombination protein 1 n=1 Tax=Kazachstania africana (strain ATCC 22294 / BCRC 22015 / CBS 2517 / CECT 1963 / NBRC 1671 / NRRL Y-8276) TaxID=1071382 RepID=H2AMY2_KAZAF|nr:hypothetical protein KAFR_0A02960 [Kazachstania africana CBS 2517]CCF55732.1 hypothetical protein KAFR_0A02960 [Kazachstania africana CBS 2517]